LSPEGGFGLDFGFSPRSGLDVDMAT
jgi:hypothetical protein